MGLEFHIPQLKPWILSDPFAAQMHEAGPNYSNANSRGFHGTYTLSQGVSMLMWGWTNNTSDHT